MTIDQVQAVIKARPFQPFTIHLADGRSYEVRHAEFISHTQPAGRTIIVFKEGESFDIIDLLLVVSIEVHGKRAEAS